jgi:nitrogen fixation/metabolism regulation signal transduction histidine kinase
LHFAVVKPVIRVGSGANAVALGNFDAEEYDRPGNDKITSLAVLFNRMRRNLGSALKLLDPSA